jgi:hypothetical protein
MPSDHSPIRILPDFCPHNAPPGEKAIFNLLKNDPGTAGWVVLHSLDLAEHQRQAQGEADFVIFIPREGVVVLEVKSHLSARRDERGWWLGNATTPDPRGPFRQASEAMHSILCYLSQRGAAQQRIPFISAVAFPSLAFNIRSPEWHSWQILDRQSIGARPLSQSLLTLMGNARRHYASKGLHHLQSGNAATSQVLHSIAETLRPRFEILASPSARRQQLEDNLLESTNEQFRILDLLSSNPRIIVSGLAGTGKTTLALEAMRRFKSTARSAAAALFCFNKHLGEKLEGEFEDVTGLVVGSIYQWMLRFLQTTPTPTEVSSSSFWNDTLPAKVIEKLTRPGMEGGYLEYLVLDEAQDLLRDPFPDIFDLLLKGGLRNGHWMLFGDFERQNLYTRGAINLQDFIAQRADHRCTTSALSVNCRNTREISEILTILSRLKPGYTRVLRPDTYHTPKPLFYNNSKSQGQAATEVLGKLLNEGFRQSDIVILSPYRDNALALQLEQYPQWKGRIRPYTLRGNTIRYSTIHAFKGLDAPVVILTDIDHLDDTMRLDLFYTGMSRALHRLILLCHDDVRSNLQSSIFKPL